MDQIGRRALATPEEVSDYLGIPVKTLYQWRTRGNGPKSLRVGRHLRYEWPELDRWLQVKRDTP